MLQSIRDRTHGWIAGIIISLVILSFALWGIHSYLEGASNSQVVAKVNGVEISKQQLATTFETLRNQVQSRTNKSFLPEEVQVSLKKQALDALINIQVMRQASVKQHFTLSNLQVETYLETMADFKENGEFSLPRFKQLLANNRLSVDDFLQLLRTTLLIDQPKAGIVLTSFVLPGEMKQVVGLINQERDVTYAVLPRTAFNPSDSEIKEAEIKTYYQQHEDEFKTPEQISLAYLELNAKEIANQIHITSEDIKKYYDENVSSYTDPAEWKLDKILIPVSEKTTEAQIEAAKTKITQIQDKIITGSDSEFSKFAQQYPAEKKNEAWVNLAQVPAELRPIVSKLNRKGQVSDILKVAKGLMLIKVIDYKEPNVKSLESVKDRVNEAVSKQKTQEKFAELKEKLASLTYESPSSLDSAAKALNLSIKHTELFSKDKPSISKDISADPKIREIAFTPDVLNSENNSDAIQLTPDSVVVVRIASHLPAAILSLSQVQSRVIDQIKAEKANKIAGDTAKQILAKLNSGTSPDELAKDFHLNWEKPGFINRFSKNLNPILIDAAFKIARTKSSNPVLAYTTVKIPEGYAILILNGIREGVIPNPKEIDNYVGQVENMFGTLEYKMYEKSYESKAKVKITQS